MLLYNVFQKYGAKTAIDLNRAAIKSMSAFEIPRLKKIMGVDEVMTYEQLKDFIKGAFEFIGADFMKFCRQYPVLKILTCIQNLKVKNLSVIGCLEAG